MKRGVVQVLAPHLWRPSPSLEEVLVFVRTNLWVCTNPAIPGSPTYRNTALTILEDQASESWSRAKRILKRCIEKGTERKSCPHPSPLSGGLCNTNNIIKAVPQTPDRHQNTKSLVNRQHTAEESNHKKSHPATHRKRDNRHTRHPTHFARSHSTTLPSA